MILGIREERISHVDEHAFVVTTAMFESVRPAPDFINPRCFGADFAHWLGAALQARGLTTQPPIAEDWGWLLPVTYRERLYHIALGIMDESVGVSPAEWRLDVESAQSPRSSRDNSPLRE